MAEDRGLGGGCLCGAVRFVARGEPVNVAFCHCRTCQKAMGAPFFARALYRADRVTVSGATARFASSPELWRVFCPACGTTLFGARQDGGHMGIALAAFDDQAALTPTHHFFVESQAPWARIDDDLPQYPQWAPD
jgi:hypothetical protein